MRKEAIQKTIVLGGGYTNQKWNCTKTTPTPNMVLITKMIEVKLQKKKREFFATQKTSFNSKAQHKKIIWSLDGCHERWVWKVGNQKTWSMAWEWKLTMRCQSKGGGGREVLFPLQFCDMKIWQIFPKLAKLVKFTQVKIKKKKIPFFGVKIMNFTVGKQAQMPKRKSSKPSGWEKRGWNPNWEIDVD